LLKLLGALFGFLFPLLRLADMLTDSPPISAVSSDGSTFSTVSATSKEWNVFSSETT
jgi:hypothetical protein